MALPVDRRHAFSRLIPRPERQLCSQSARRARISSAASRGARASPLLSRPRGGERPLPPPPTPHQSFMCLLLPPSGGEIAQLVLRWKQSFFLAPQLAKTSPPLPEA